MVLGQGPDDGLAPLADEHSIGSRLLEYVNEVWFIRLYETVLTLIALSLTLTIVLA